ncbi:endonuclease [Maribacter algarum]|uniref:Endonuclease n=1 Tax=Maribacter algarum (ex Zhang et al. 2020) TaxID=2578118 RepID=A0A5S3PI22_9FLAO|nr:endonuclease/exonuclease/phosphatase family protein [Maribacter algarum]TMM53852.1 endonuclease [Maribacter algarum]
MKRLSAFNKVVFVLNAIAALLLLAACAVPYISNEKFSFLSFLSLTVPLLVGMNFFSLLFWMLKRRRQLWLSLFVLVFGYFTLGTFLKFNFWGEDLQEEDLSIMSYNVRGFNRYNQLDNPNVFEDVKSLIDKEQPDIICFQEAGYTRKKEFLDDYPYQYLDYIYMDGKVLLGIFSKYPIVNRDFVCFPDSPNNAAYADILYKKDTIRVYNVHLQSLGITPGKGIIQNKPKDKLFKMLNENFKIQQQQAKMLEADMKTVNYKQILCGDFNNTQFSNAYKIIKGDKVDTFIEEGSGYGRTLNFHGIPVRIDFILADPEFEVKSHKNYDEEYSDHFPIMASFKLK